VKVIDGVCSRQQFVSIFSVKAIAWANNLVTADRGRNAASEAFRDMPLAAPRSPFI
jgi:hypothetical protein